MMFRTKALGNAILAACELVGRDKATMGGEIAEKYGLPTAYASKAMTQLAKVQVARNFHIVRPVRVFVEREENMKRGAVGYVQFL